MNSNYKLIKREFLEDVNINASIYKHIKSGARIITFDCDDINKVFTIGFKTPPADDTGVPHILEHSTLCGSKKFPVKDPFNELLKSSLNTFLNAGTFPDKTIYPCASCNDKDFKNLMDVYLDAVFNPNVYENEKIFRQEGWRYELNDKDEELKYNGVVYNEMKGAFSDPTEIVARESKKYLFPDTTYGFESGGDPTYIPDLTYEAFKNFHSKYYSPSNSYIFLYGKMDYEERLDFLDREYLSNYEDDNQVVSIEVQKPFAEPCYKTIYYPISKDSGEEDNTFYSFNVAIGTTLDNELVTAMNIVTYVLLSMPGAPLKQALLDANLGKDIYGDFDSSILQPMFYINSKDAPSGKEKEFERVINETLERIVKEGLNKKALLAAINNLEFRDREMDTGRLPKGVLFGMMLLETWLYEENETFSSFKYSIYSELKKKVETDFFEQLIQKHLLDNNHKVYIVAKPSKTLGEETEQSVKNRLAKYKKSLTDEELEQIIKDTKELKEYQDTPSSQESLDKMPKLTLDDVDDYVEPFVNEEKNIGDITIVEHPIFTNGIAYLTCLFNAENVGNDDICTLSLLLNLLGYVSTKNKNYIDLSIEIQTNTGNIATGLSIQSFDDKAGFIPYAFISSKYLYGNEKFVFDTFADILTNSLFDDKKRMFEIIAEMKSDFGIRLQSSGSATAVLRASSYIFDASAYADLTRGIGYYNYIKDLVANFDARFNFLVENLKRVSNVVFRRENLIVSYTSPNNYYKDYIEEFADKLYKEPFEKKQFVFVPCKKQEGFKTPGQVQYVAMVSNFDKSKYNGAMQALKVALNFDYLYIKIRLMGGAYGCSNSINRDGMITFSSYRDPKLKETFNIYNNVDKFIEEMNYKKEELEHLIISAVGDSNNALPPSMKGNRSMSAYLAHTDIENIKRIKKELLSATLEEIKSYKDIYVNSLKDAAICVIGNENVIEQNKELFKSVENL